MDNIYFDRWGTKYIATKNDSFHPQNDKDDLYFEGFKKPEDALKSAWIRIEDVKDLNIHYIHKIAMKKLGGII